MVYLAKKNWEKSSRPLRIDEEKGADLQSFCRDLILVVQSLSADTFCRTIFRLKLKKFLFLFFVLKFTMPFFSLKERIRFQFLGLFPYVTKNFLGSKDGPCYAEQETNVSLPCPQK
ncbi:hypothetical protein BpHYR1_028957 [Brachionus plicatilis]|uniref:Uncharacterized protein n=1 Tax=Brachionus plicatilis TaxID=10195 RepID=A0A3M7SFU1_BRAPC|nr:hypothetical protein BpHYR1_028957 [Brachionus plicatilis]